MASSETSRTPVEVEWRPVVGAPMYEISDTGLVVSLFFGRKPIKTYVNVKKGGYLQVALRVDGRPKNFKVHRMVAAAFLGDHPELDVNHENGVKTDNRLSNLTWMTGKQNQQHAWKMGLLAVPGAKLTEFDVSCIRADTAPSKELAAIYKVSTATINRIKQGVIWKHVV